MLAMLPHTPQRAPAATATETVSQSSQYTAMLRGMLTNVGLSGRDIALSSLIWVVVGVVERLIGEAHPGNDAVPVLAPKVATLANVKDAGVVIFGDYSSQVVVSLKEKQCANREPAWKFIRAMENAVDCLRVTLIKRIVNLHSIVPCLVAQRLKACESLGLAASKVGEGDA